VNWTTFAAEQPRTGEHSRRRPNPLVFTLFLAAQNAGSTDRPKGIELLQSAIEIDPYFATGFWTLGALLKADGQIELAEKAFTRAKEIDPEVSNILDIDPTEAVTRTLLETAWKENEPGLWGLSMIQPDYDIGLRAWRFDLSRFSFEIAEQEHEKGEDVRWLHDRPGVVLAVNGGFFEKDISRRGIPVCQCSRKVCRPSEAYNDRARWKMGNGVK
jgi:tetratricopeptide (TPR) repeat protein